MCLFLHTCIGHWARECPEAPHHENGRGMSDYRNGHGRNIVNDRRGFNGNGRGRGDYRGGFNANGYNRRYAYYKLNNNGIQPYMIHIAKRETCYFVLLRCI